MFLFCRVSWAFLGGRLIVWVTIQGAQLIKLLSTSTHLFKEIYVIFIGTGLLCQACLTERWVHRENVLLRWPKYRVLFCMHAFLNFRLNVSKAKTSGSSYQASMNRTVAYYQVNSILVCGTFFVESLVNSNSCSLWRVHIKKIS